VLGLQVAGVDAVFDQCCDANCEVDPKN
jgi:hypothetical protein